MKYFKRISLIVVAVLVLACSVPLSSMAVDPVSAATMANAFAQAITAYGASQGVSMTFDVANTDGIGEGVHDLWEQYANDMAQSNVTVSDYSNLAASVFPTLWKKTIDYVTVSLDAATVGEIDGFWNWLLSGPAQMTKVDNQYYEWTINQSGTVTPITVQSSYSYIINNHQTHQFPYVTAIYQGRNYEYYFGSADSFYFTAANNNNSGYAYLCTLNSNSILYHDYYNGAEWVHETVSYNNSDTNGDLTIYYYSIWGTLPSGIAKDFQRSSSNDSTPLDYFGTITSGSVVVDGNAIDVRPYVGDTAPQNVYIPDNTDVNYTPVAAEIPLDIPWNDELYGDGTGTITDAQSEAITRAADDAITDNPDKTLELADTAPTPPVPDPSEVYIPFLPVTLPSFQFSLSGIWHYVTAWVASLGAWFSLVFTTWSYLPYAISVPVYATAVIVIVLGVYKRFFM